MLFSRVISNRLCKKKNSSNWGHFDGKVRYSNVRTIPNTRIIRVFFQKVFYIRASTIPTRIGNPSTNVLSNTQKNS